MGILNIFKKKKKNIKWENAQYTITRTDSFDKVEALQTLCRILDLGFLDAKKLLEAKDKLTLPIADIALFRKLEDALAKAGADINVYVKDKLIDKNSIPESEAEIDDTSDEETRNPASSSCDDEEESYYPDESEEPLIDYATGEILGSAPAAVREEK